MTKTYIGIDTGINGAAVALDEYGEMMGMISLPHTKVIPCYRKSAKPKVAGKARSELDVAALKKWLCSFLNVEMIAVEESPSYGMGVTSAYTSGYNSGRLAALCISLLGDKFQTVAPKTWQKELFGDIIEASKDGWNKERSIRLAQMQHGTLLVFEKPVQTADGFADACHIAEWGRRQ